MWDKETISWIGPGGVIAERYVVEAVAGAGGVGVVYRARDRESAELVAVKLVPKPEGGARSRFEREAAALRELSHPAIVRYLAHGFTAEGSGYLVMEWLEGEDLKLRLARGPLTVAESATLARRVADALGEAHARGLIHRDVKPSNLLIVGGAIDQVKLVDFGLARTEARDPDLTRTGALLGTPGYMAPEQARGATDLDPRVDVFALGCVIYECLTGAPAFDGESPFAVLSNVLTATPAPVATRRADAPPALSALVERMLAKNPAVRPADARAVAAELAAQAAASGPARVHEVAIERPIAGDPALVWALFCDTNRWNRVMGSPPSQYAYEPIEGAVTRVGRAEIAGVASRWIEVGEWVEGRFAWGERRFLDGLFQSIRVAVEITKIAEGARLAARVTLTARGDVSEAPLQMLGAHLEKRLGQLADAVDRACRSAPAASDPDEPAGARAARLALAMGPDRVLNGKAAETRAADLGFRRRALDEAAIDASARDRVLRFVTESPDELLRQVRPFALAEVWALDRRAVLAAFLHATRAGLFDLRWLLHCPVCRVASAVAPSLASLDGHGHCHECRIDYDLDLAANVEAVFHVNPALRDVPAEVYCAGSPAFRPHVFAVLRAEPHASREVFAALPHAPIAVRALAIDGGLVALSAHPPASIVVRVGAAGLHVEAEGEAHETRIELINETGRPVTVHLERTTPGADAASGATLLTLPEFVDLFSAEAPAAGLELTVSTLTVLFAQLTGVDELCARLGDARAVHPLVRALDAVRAAIAAHEGAALRTMGETVMACFTSPAEALAAVADVAAHLAHAADHADVRELAVRAGISQGACLLVQSGDRLELFGGTVGAARRRMSRAAAGEIAVQAPLLEHAEIARFLTRGSMESAGVRVTAA